MEDKNDDEKWKMKIMCNSVGEKKFSEDCIDQKIETNAKGIHIKVEVRFKNFPAFLMADFTV